MGRRVSLELPGCGSCGRGENVVYDFDAPDGTDHIVEFCLAEAGAPEGQFAQRGYIDYSWGRLNGQRASAVLVILEKALTIARSERRAEQDFRKHRSALETVRGMLEDFILACRAHPDAVVDAWG